MSKGRDLLEAYRAVSEVEDQPDPAVLEGIEASIAAAEAPRRAAAAVFLVASVSVAAGLTAVLAWPRPIAAVSEATVSEALDRARLPEPRTRIDVPVPTPEARPPIAPEPAPSVAPGIAPKPAPTPAEDTLVRELALLRAAKTAMAGGRLSQAKASLREHGRAFPNGQLSEDREALWVVVRCGEGSPNTGRAAFEAAHPSSHHLAAIRTACEKK